LFTFQVDHDKTEVTVHSLVLEKMSPGYTLMNGQMKGATARLVDWSDVDEDTFARFCEFAYLQDYTLPSSL